MSAKVAEDVGFHDVLNEYQESGPYAPNEGFHEGKGGPSTQPLCGGTTPVCTRTGPCTS